MIKRQNWAKWLLFAIFIYFLIPPSRVRAEDFQIFDGHSYNGKFYPRIDIIEWGEPSHMEFHVYNKGKPIKMTFELETKTGKSVMLVHYWITERDEHLCRRVLTPAGFAPNFMVYQDNSDPDFDNTLVTMNRLDDKPGQQLVLDQPKYAACGDDGSGSVAAKSNTPAPNTQSPPSTDTTSRVPAGKPDPNAPTYKTQGAGTTIKAKDGGAAFSDW